MFLDTGQDNQSQFCQHDFSRTKLVSKIWFHFLLAGVCCGCVRLSESAAVESSLRAQNKPLEAKHQRTVFQANHKLDG